MVCAVVAGDAGNATLSLDPHSKDQPAASLYTHAQELFRFFLIHVGGILYCTIGLCLRAVRKLSVTETTCSHVGEELRCLHQGDVAAKA
jgi:hypothetical protein